ncbi:MAG: hypothetical protein A2Z32_08990 [Chloroflexi bacterium RBG_16_69_14]|nr:MAG: hypothetical protein A2Z32_08990 [Chloroflexi bacterium RBG_16_69_14]
MALATGLVGFAALGGRAGWSLAIFRSQPSTARMCSSSATVAPHRAFQARRSARAAEWIAAQRELRVRPI